MPRGDKSAHTEKQERQAEHIEESELEQGRSQEAAERIAWATVNKQDGGGKLSESGRKASKKMTTKAIKKKRPEHDGAAIRCKGISPTNEGPVFPGFIPDRLSLLAGGWFIWLSPSAFLPTPER